MRKINNIDIESTNEFKKKNISIQNLEILNLNNDKKRVHKNKNLINDILNNDNTFGLEENENNNNEINPKQFTQKENGRKLFWGGWAKKISSGVSNVVSKKQQASKPKPKPKPKKKKRIRVKIRKPIPPYKMGKWRPTNKLVYPRFSLKPYSPDYCACKRSLIETDLNKEEQFASSLQIDHNPNEMYKTTPNNIGQRILFFRRRKKKKNLQNLKFNLF